MKIHKIDSKLLNRTEINVELPHIGRATLSNKEVKELLSKELKAEENLLVIRHIHGIYGREYSKVKALLYKDKESLERLERKPKIKKENGKEETKK